MPFSLSASVVDEKKIPSASLVASTEFAVLGSVVTLDGRLSSDPESAPLSYHFIFYSVPIGSKVADEGFRPLSDSGAMCAFSPDVVGRYEVGLVVSNGVFESSPARLVVDVRAILVPHARGLVPDGKFIWSYLRDAWTQVDGREFFETLWSALIQISGAELLKLYQVDFNKSIRDVQDLYQRRWLKYEPRLALDEDDCTFFLGNHLAGRSASTGSAGDAGLAIITGEQELLVVQGTVRPDLAGRLLQILYSRSPANVGSYVIAGTTAKSGGFRLTSELPKNPSNTQGEVSDVIVRDVGIQFDFGSTTWSVGVTKQWDFVLSELYGFPYYKTEVPPGLEDVRVGDVAVIQSGVNAGLYRIVEKSGAYIVVDKKPAGASGGPESSSVTIYRPVGFVIPAVETDLSDTIAVPLSEANGLDKLVPGRLIVVNGEAHTVTRVAADLNQRVPLLSISVEEKNVVPGLRGISWRVPHTLVSKTQNFEELGVMPGDVLVAALAIGDLTIDVPCQVVGVDRNRLGFVFSNEPVQDGQVPDLPDDFILAVAERFGIEGAEIGLDGELHLSKEAASLVSESASIYFQRAYWNQELDASDDIVVGKRTWHLIPRAVIRNRLVPVDGDVRSIPALQEYISQPALAEENGQLFMARGEKRFPLSRKPVVLLERSHYLVDGDSAISGSLTFRTGTDVVEVEGGDFVDLGIMPGDVFHIETPITLYGDYPVVSVISRNRLRLARPIPKFPLSLFVTGRVLVQRKRSGRFIRLIPGLFTVKNPAPNRLWAETTFFDNGENIERNFGVLVGLTRQDLEATTSQASYRQAVAGLMFAYMSGPAVDKIRLGASLLLGLPFTEKKGIIRSIDTSYRVDSAGTPVLGRILVEDLDENEAPAGMSRVYTFPVDPVSELSGVDVNPATNKPYAVGDTVEAFASLSKGVQLDDFTVPFRGTPTAIQTLQRFHSARVRVNDNIFQPKEISLVSSFFRKITPSYVALVISNTSEFRDQVTVSDRVKLSLLGSRFQSPSFVDTAGLNLPIAAIYDLRSTKGIFSLRWDDGLYVMLRAGSDLVINNAGDVSLPAGGFLTPRAGESFEAPLVRPGDFLLVADGYTEGLYPILAVTNTELTVDSPQLAAAPYQHYAIFRPISGLARAGAISAKADSVFDDLDTGRSYQQTELTVEPGLRVDMVAPGDWVTTDLGTRHLVVKVAKTGSIWNKMTVTPQVGGTAADYRVWRAKTFTNPVFSVTDGALPAHLTALLDVGDELQVQRADGLTVVVTNVSPATVSPALPAGTYDVKLLKPGVGDTPLVYEHSTRTITDHVTLTLQ